jgi:hypothetical protein
MRRVVALERRLRAIAVRPPAGRILRRRDVPHPEVRKGAVAGSERRFDELRDALERGPELVVHECERERHLLVEELGNTIAQRAEHGLGQHVRHVDVALDAKIRHQLGHVAQVETRTRPIGFDPELRTEGSPEIQALGMTRRQRSE